MALFVITVYNDARQQVAVGDENSLIQFNAQSGNNYYVEVTGTAGGSSYTLFIEKIGDITHPVITLESVTVSPRENLSVKTHYIKSNRLNA